MIIDVDYKRFQEKFNAHYPENPLTETEAKEAFHNVVGFVNTLILASKNNSSIFSINEKPQ